MLDLRKKYTIRATFWMLAKQVTEDRSSMEDSMISICLAETIFEGQVAAVRFNISDFRFFWVVIIHEKASKIKYLPSHG